MSWCVWLTSEDRYLIRRAADANLQRRRLLNSTRSQYACASRRRRSQAGFSFAGATSELLEELPNRDVKVVVDSASVNVFTGQQQPRACGEARSSAVVTAEDDICAKRVVRETNYWSDLVARKPAQRVAQREVMCRNVDR